MSGLRRILPDSGGVLAAAGAWVMLLGAAPGCEPYRVEYHKRPSYYKRLSDDLPDRVVLDDGTVIIYNETGKASGGGGGEGGGERKKFEMREELEDGTVVLRAIMPEHVIGNTLHCLQMEEYELLWDQMLSERTRMAYEARDEDFEDFAAFMQKHRAELGRMLNRMLMGLSSHEVVIENAGDNTLICRFWPQVAQLFRFKKVAMVHEDFGLKLLLIY